MQGLNPVVGNQPYFSKKRILILTWNICTMDWHAGLSASMHPGRPGPARDMGVCHGILVVSSCRCIETFLFNADSMDWYKPTLSRKALKAFLFLHFVTSEGGNELFLGFGGHPSRVWYMCCVSATCTVYSFNVFFWPVHY